MIKLFAVTIIFWDFDSFIAKSFSFMFHMFSVLILWDWTIFINSLNHSCMTDHKISRNHCWQRDLILLCFSLECQFKKIWDQWDSMYSTSAVFCDFRIVIIIFCSMSMMREHSWQHWCQIQFSRIFFSLKLSNWYWTCSRTWLWCSWLQCLKVDNDRTYVCVMTAYVKYLFFNRLFRIFWMIFSCFWLFNLNISFDVLI